jgi:hypothetical protein
MRAGRGWLVLLAVVPVLLPGCGESAEAERLTPKRLLAQASERTIREGGTVFDATIRSDDGSFELRSRGRATLDLLASHVRETFEESPTEELEGATNEAIYKREISYIRTTGERRWLAFSGNPWGPADRVFYLPRVATSLRDSGSERVLGVDATRIDGVWDAKRLLAQLSGPDLRFQRRVLRGIERTRMPVTVWIDQDGRIRQLRLKADMRYLFGFLEGQLGTETFRFRRFDSGIEIEDPPPRMIRNWSKLAP